MFRVWLSAGLVLSLLSGAVAQQQSATERCRFAGQTVPCTVETAVEGHQTLTLVPLEKTDWEFLERDMAPDATALHADLLNHPTWDKAQRYALAQIYRQYRALQAMKLAAYARFKIMAQIKARYGDLDELALMEAVVLEAGLPVIQVPSGIGDLTLDGGLDLGAQRGGEKPDAK
jgi:hypothetical protein